MPSNAEYNEYLAQHTVICRRSRISGKRVFLRSSGLHGTRFREDNRFFAMMFDVHKFRDRDVFDVLNELHGIKPSWLARKLYSYQFEPYDVDAVEQSCSELMQI